MRKILLSAFACEPDKGSEQGNGWNWAKGLAEKGYVVHCLTRSVNRPSIETHPPIDNLHFHYVAMPLGTEALYLMTQASIYLHYMLWQYLAYKKGKSLHRAMKFELAHHVTWGSLQMGSFLYRLRIPFIFGPAGGGQQAPENFRRYFLNHWNSELKREKVSNWMIKYNPACKKMLKKADVVLVSNQETLAMAKAIGAKNCQISLDMALPESFFPEQFKQKKTVDGHLKLLWVGRFMPRKGLLLVLDVMQQLKDLPEITLTIVGYGEMEEIISAKIKEYALEDTVKMVGHVLYEQVRLFYDMHDIFFFTSLRDSGPAQLLEAQAFGMPIITLNLHGQSQVVTDRTGIRCDASSPEIAIPELKKAIIHLHHHPQIVSEMSIAASEFARKQTMSEKISNIVNSYYPV
ncbi:glycosyltransferase family 4 protein [Mucilaginibacter sabulilitoris]|uniref:Glycosyltransferase family 4 protein n=1 Tax=Mucilaginibacter sabulilitoris TaxID=1173583 RepID=A0ABZ0TW61_9SPHI|nr:glycosyltransferase family 4 protein [Mucilaginibacter sabulilitoris]WPU95690.1 glycosyltransferase family 4 protein [Mucilaginibacter sabulilitoris]